MKTPREFVPDDLGTPATIADPYPVYRALRDRSPVRYLRIPGGAISGIADPIHAYALLRHSDTVAALRDPGTFSSDVMSVFPIVPRLTLLHDDPPRHTHLRRIVNRAFSPRRVADLEPWIGRVAASLFDELGEGEVDLVRGYAVPLPVQVIAHLLGVPPEEYAQFRRWSEAVTSYRSMLAEERQANARDMAAYMAKMLAARRERPANDLLTALVEAEVEGARLETPEAVGFCMLLLVAGNDTTSNLLGNMMHILAERPDLYRRAREDRSLVDPIIGETLRYESPVQRLVRVTTRPVSLSGVEIPQGSVVDVMYGAANRDPEVFDDPETFRLDRPLSASVAFGHGAHYCLGTPLAWAEARITLNMLLDRYEALSLGTSPPVRQQRGMMPFGFDALPLSLRKARG
ncbi:cytochrome P450 [Polyangium aurulentum]|uniref:cytochrome P450 n=1 Tax=Polyangium aurulentum TaxID=2567896 RepID=UPI0010ADEECF|nr:cytochrome P450 [Polyangium aurulentum]UQA59719.1 cytochrome P450 [Polyangium aurulentum]